MLNSTPMPYDNLGKALMRDLRRTNQSSLAKSIGVSQSTVSQWLKGKKRPQPVYLIELAHRFDLDLNEYAVLADYDSEQLHELYFRRYRSPIDPEFMSVYAYSVYSVRIAGQPQLCIQMADDLETLLDRRPGTKHGKEIQKIRARVLSEKAIAIRETCSTNEVLSRIKPISQALLEIGERYDDLSIVGLSHACLVDAYYIYKLKREAINQAYQGIAALKNSKNPEDIDNRLLMMRTLLVCLSLLHEKETFEKEAAKAIGYVDRGEFTHAEVVCTLLEGIATSQGNLRISGALDTLDLAWQYYGQAKRETNSLLSFRFIQLARSGLQSAHNLGTKDTSEFETRVLEGLRLAQEHGYKRYTDQLNTLCKTI